MTNKTNWKTIESKLIYKNKWMELIEDKVVLEKNGKKIHEGIYAYANKRKSVFVIARDNQQRIFMIKQNRYPLDKILIELPAGSTDGQASLAAAKRELFEEIGVKADRWILLGSFYPIPSSGNQECMVYLAEDLDEGFIHNEPNEAIEDIFKVTEKELIQLLKENKIQDGETLAALNIFFYSNYSNDK